MIALSAQEIAKIVDGQLHATGDLVVTAPPSIDSRDVARGSIFLALKGEHVDGHDFAGKALKQGAVLVLSSQKIDGPCIVVKDVVAAIGLLAAYVRRQLPNLVVIGITGSQGKTTSKDLLSWILSMADSTIAAVGSFNNELGVPLTLLRCAESTKYCIVEMGARHKGDIKALSTMAAPNIGVVLKVGSAHVGEFGSLEAIASTKAELVEALDEEGIAILGRYDEFTPKMGNGLKSSVITFGETHEAHIRASDIDMREGRAHFDLVTPEGRAAVGLRLVGSHQIANALAAAAVATGLGIPLDVIAGGLSTAEVVNKWRMELHELSNLLLINDVYNANPESTAAALRTLALFAQERGGQSWAFLGKMHELGASSDQEHASIGTLAESLGIDHLVCVGTPEYGADVNKQGEMSTHFYPSKALAVELSKDFAEGDVVLVKASRAERMEELAANIIENWNERVGLVE